MHRQYERILDRYRELQEELNQPDVTSDPARYQAVVRELAELEERVSAWQTYLDQLEARREAEEMLADPELADLAGQEIQQLNQTIPEQEQLLRHLLLPPDPSANRNVILEIRAGAGGEESALFSADLYRMYDHYAARHGWKLAPISASPTELGGYKEIVCSVTGHGVWSGFKYESGVHRVQRVPVTESSGRKQTSTCTVAVLPEAEAVELDISPNDLRIDTYRASGAGGQYVNRTDSAVRITHIPTGMVVTCQDEKSQLRNREQAMRVLRARLLQAKRDQAASAQAESRRIQVGTGDRSERIRTYNFHESRVTDHRIGLTLFRIQEIMDGDLDEIVNALRLADEEARWKAAAAES